MYKLVVVILSVAFLAASIPSVFSAPGDSCATSKVCLDNSNKTECCVQDADGTKTCQTVTAETLTTTFDLVSALPLGASVTRGLQSTVDSLDAGLPLTLNAGICSLYSKAENIINEATKLVPGVL